MLNETQARKKAQELTREAGTEWMRLRRFVRYSRGQMRLPWLPDNAESEYRDIARKSVSNWAGLVVGSTAQGLHLDGYGDRTDQPEASEDGGLWSRVWQPNGMDARQHALHRAVLTLGYSYMIVLPAEDGGVWMRPEAATSMFALYGDPTDEWPQFAVRRLDGKPMSRLAADDKMAVELYDAEARYVVRGTQVETHPHELGVCPAVQMVGCVDLLGAPMGEIEPVIPILDRIVDATFNMQMASKYGAFPQRWISGIDTTKPLEDAEGNPVTDVDGNPVYPSIKAYVDSIITASDPDTKFGQFQAADLRQYVEALEAHVRHLAAITQTPPHYLLGDLVNLSADALASAEAGLMRKVRDRQDVLGEGYEQALRLAAAIIGDDEAAADTSSQVHWQDVESRSLAQVADALAKLATVGVPLPMLFEMIPGWTRTDVERAIQAIEEGDVIGRLVGELTAAQPPPVGVGVDG